MALIAIIVIAIFFGVLWRATIYGPILIISFVLAIFPGFILGYLLSSGKGDFSAFGLSYLFSVFIIFVISCIAIKDD